MKTLVFVFCLMTASVSSSAMGYPQSVFSHQRALTQQIELKKVNIPPQIEPLTLADANFREKIVNAAVFVTQFFIKWLV